MAGKRASRRRSAYLAAASAALGVLLSACDSAPAPTPPTPTPTAAPDRPVTVNARLLPPSLLPADVSDRTGEDVARVLFRGLVRYDEKGMAVPEVASSITSGDDRTYRVRLESGWTFSDGEPVTAASFVDAWNFAARRSSGQFRATEFAPILGYDAVRRPGGDDTLAGLQVLDDRTFTVTLTDARPGFENRLGDPAFAPLPRAALADPAAFAKRPVGNGPYLLADGMWPAANAPLTLRPNTRYPGDDVARNGGIVLRPYSTLEAAWSDFEAGRLDVVDEVPPARLGDVRDTYAERASAQAVGQADALVFPVAHAPWSGEAGYQRRLAISRAIDRERATGEVYGGLAEAATDLAAPVVAGSSRDLCGATCERDEDAAREAARQAGGLDPNVRIAYAADTPAASAVVAVCRDLDETLGTQCRGVEYPSELALAEAVALGRERNPHVETWRMNRPALAAFLEPRFTPGAPANTSGYAEPLAQTKFDVAATAPENAQPAAYQEGEAAVLRDLPVVPLWNRHATSVRDATITDVHTDVFGSLVYPKITRPRPAG